jgi:multiple antibiotic resistance protein
VLTTLLLLADEYGRLPTVLASSANILIAGALFSTSRQVHRLLGKAGTRTVSKIAALVMAAFAVMMVRKGVMAFLPPHS